MRKPRDIDAELKALHDKQKQLRARRVVQFGELVTATGADALDPETLAGALLEAIERTKADPSTKEAWRRSQKLAYVVRYESRLGSSLRRPAFSAAVFQCSRAASSL